MITINAELRDVKVNPKMIRKEGKIPAVFYGAGHPSTAIAIEKASFLKILQEAGESTIVSLKTPKESFDVLIHDVDLDPVMGDPIHVDFYAVSKDHVIEVDIPLEFVGVAGAEKLGGVVVKVMHELKVKALPGALPQHITIDLSTLTDLSSHIAVSDVKLPQGVKAVAHDTDIIVSVAQQRAEEEAPVAQIDLSKIEVEKKGKKEEEEAAE